MRPRRKLRAHAHCHSRRRQGAAGAASSASSSSRIRSIRCRMPSRELTARVIEHLRRRAPAGIAGGIRVITPSYVQVGVRAEILPLRADEAGKVEARVRAQLARFAHPFTGGPDELGWQFGQSVYLSDVAAADRAHARRRRGALSAVDDRFGGVWRSRPSLARAADRSRRIAAEDSRSERALCPCLSPRSTTASMTSSSPKDARRFRGSRRAGPITTRPTPASRCSSLLRG